MTSFLWIDNLQSFYAWPEELTFLVENFYGWNSVWCSMFSWCRCSLSKVCSRFSGRHVPQWLLAAVLVVHRRQEPFQTFNSSSLSFCILYLIFCIFNLYFLLAFVLEVLCRLKEIRFKFWPKSAQNGLRMQLILIDTTGGCSGSKSSRWQDALGASIIISRINNQQSTS